MTHGRKYKTEWKITVKAMAAWGWSKKEFLQKCQSLKKNLFEMPVSRVVHDDFLSTNNMEY